MQDEIYEFDLLDVWELVPPPDYAMIIALKWIYKVKLDEYGDVLKNKARLVAKGYRQEEGIPVDKDTIIERMVFGWPDVYQQPSRPDLVFCYVHMYPKDTAMALTAYVDADHAGCQNTRRSTSGSTQFLGDKLVSWSSKKQTSTSISSTKAEYIAIEQVEKRVVELYFVRTEYQLADIFTKALPRERFEFILPRLGMKSMQPETLKRIQDDKDDYFRLQPAFQNEESLSPKRRMFLTTGDSVLPGMDYFIFVHSRSNVRFSALFLDPEEKSSFYPNDFPSMILLKIICVSNGGNGTNCAIYAPAPKPAKGAKPKPAPAKPQEKKRKRVLDASEAASQAKTSKAGSVSKKRTLQLRDEFRDEGVPVSEPRVDDEEATLQKVLEESMKDAYPAPRGPLPPVVIREPEPGKYQPLPEVQGKGKEKVSDEQVARDLLTLQTPKKRSPTEQYIFLKHTPAPTQPSGHEESSSLYAELGLSDSDTESDEEVPPVVKSGTPDEGQAGPNPGMQDEGQAGPNLGMQDEGQARPNPSDSAEPQPQSTPVAHARPNLEHADVEASKTSTQSHPEQMDEGFTAIAYPKVQESLKLTVDEQVIPEEPASSTGRLSSLQNLSKDLSFGYQFFNDKPSKADNEKTTADTEVESMVSVTIHQDTSAIPPMTSPVIDLTRIVELEQYIADLVDANSAMEERLDKHGTRLYNLENLDIPHQVFEDKSYEVHEDHKNLYDALEKSLESDYSDQLLADLAEARRKKKRRHDSPNTPPGSLPHQPPPPPPPAGLFGTSGTSGASGSSQVPHPPPPSTNQSDQSKSTDAPSSSKTAASAEYMAWTTTKTRIMPSISSIPEELHMDDNTTADEHAYSSGGEDIGRDHIPTITANNWAFALASTYAPPPENSLLAQIGDMVAFMNWYNVSKPLPLGGPPGQVSILSDFFFNKDLEYIRDGGKIGRQALSFSKMKAAYYPDVGLEQMVPDQMWIEEECKYDIAAMYGISHWWFQRQRFYIDKHTSEGDHRSVRTHMRILSVVRIEVFSLYGYDYMKKIILRRADLKEYIIAERDFKYLYPSDFEDLYLLNLQGQLNHLSPEDKKILTTTVNLWTRNLVIRQRVEDFQMGIESYQTLLNLTKPRWDATGFEYKHDFTVIDSPRAIDEALDYRVKEFKVNRMNPGLHTRFWTRTDVDISKELMFAIEKRLKTRQIFQNLESFVGGRISEGDYRLLKRTE
ncbi:retrovirus-related pol polyprotein from transposon TNT 1-94 [Tanacetum coccineum]